MRTKVLFCAAVLAASLASSMAQNVYSLNVVGYVNVTLPSHQFYCVANPLDASMGGTIATGNDMTNLFNVANANPQAGSFIQTFIPAIADYSASITYSTRTTSWGSNFSMPPGLGVMYFNGGATPTVVTFTGQVEQGHYAVSTLGSHQFSMVGSPVPIGGDVTNSTTVVGLVPGAGDSVNTFNSPIADWNTAMTWSTRTAAWTGTPLSIAPGQGFLYFNGGAAANNWVSNFTVQ